MKRAAEAGRRKPVYQDTAFVALTTYKVRPEMANAAIQLARITGYEETEGVAVAKAFRALSKVRPRDIYLQQARERKRQAALRAARGRSRRTTSIWIQMRPGSTHGGEGFMRRSKRM